MLIKNIIEFLELSFPLSFQESYDNCGLQIGDKNVIINSVLLCLDITENVIDEAIEKKCNLIISHHPLFLKDIKSITSTSEKERVITKCIKNDIAVYAIHTNIDKYFKGLNYEIALNLCLKDIKTLSPESGMLKKLVTFCPAEHAENVRKALFGAGAGVIGNYDSCSYNIEGFGTFKGNDSTSPFVGEQNKLHVEKELRIETIYPKYLESKILINLFKSHPYEEVAYDIYPLENKFEVCGLGAIGIMDKPLSQKEFLQHIKNIFKIPFLKVSKLIPIYRDKKISKVALCGGSGSSLIEKAISDNVDAFITSDIKYHDFFIPINRDNLLLIDVGHYEMEIFFKKLLFEHLSEKFNKLAIFLAENEQNPVNYF